MLMFCDRSWHRESMEPPGVGDHGGVEIDGFGPQETRKIISEDSLFARSEKFNARSASLES